jgi:hypothetical protein
MLQAASDLWRESKATLSDAEDFNKMVPFAGQRS